MKTTDFPFLGIFFSWVIEWVHSFVVRRLRSVQTISPCVLSYVPVPTFRLEARNSTCSNVFQIVEIMPYSITYPRHPEGPTTKPLLTTPQSESLRRDNRFLGHGIQFGKCLFVLLVLDTPESDQTLLGYSTVVLRLGKQCKLIFEKKNIFEKSRFLLPKAHFRWVGLFQSFSVS